MFFKKVAKNTGRNRQAMAPSPTNRSAVFSYHASRSLRTDGTPRSQNKLLLWHGGASKGRPGSVRWLKRLPIMVAFIAFIVVGITSLIVSSEANVLIVKEKSQGYLLQNQQVYQKAAYAALDSSVLYSNKLTIDTQRIADDLRQQFPELAGVSVHLPVLGHRPTIYLQPAQPALLLKTLGGEIFILDIFGRTLMRAAQVPNVEHLKLPLVEDQSGLPVMLGETVLPRDNVAFITEVVGQLKAKGIEVTALVLPKTSSELDIKVKDAPYIIKSNLHGDARAEMGAYLAVKQYLESHKKTAGTYVDVRVDNRVYYR